MNAVNHVVLCVLLWGCAAVDCHSSHSGNETCLTCSWFWKKLISVIRTGALHVMGNSVSPGWIFDVRAFRCANAFVLFPKASSPSHIFF